MQAERAIVCAVQLMTDQEFTIDILSTALVVVRIQLKEFLVDLDLNEEVSEAIKTMQGGILAILDLLDVGDGVLEPAGGAPSASTSASSCTSPSTSTSPAATLTARTRNAAELKSELTAVYRLANRGKTEEARAALAKIPSGKELHIRSIDKAAKAMEDLLLERGGLDSVRRILDQFFDRPIIRTAMSDHLREQAQPHDTEATMAMVDSIKAFFTGTLKTRGRRTDLDRNVFYAAAAAIVPKGVRENKQMRAVMRLTGLRHDALSKAIQFRSEMDD